MLQNQIANLLPALRSAHMVQDLLLNQTILNVSWVPDFCDVAKHSTVQASAQRLRHGLDFPDDRLCLVCDCWSFVTAI
jgi:hypothetical protein